jgi:von Willebrand factor type A domain
MLSNRRERPTGRRNTTTGVTLLIDASGSMQSRRDETIRQVNRYLDDLRADGQRYRLTVITFNEQSNSLIVRKDIRDVGELERSEYRPDGWTRLLDAVGSALNNYVYNEDRNLFVTITDGAENDSRIYNLPQIRRLIDDKRSEDFQFIFLGDGPDSWSVGRGLGFNWSVATDWSQAQNSQNIYRSLYNVSSAYSKGGTISANMMTTPTTAAQSNDTIYGPTNVKVGDGNEG